MKMLNLKGSISQLSFGNPKENERVQNILLKAGINTLEQLCQKTKAELQAIDKIGDTTVRRIVHVLEKCDLQLGMTPFECYIFQDLFQAYEDFVNGVERVFGKEADSIRFVDRDLHPEKYANGADYENDGDEEFAHHLTLNVHNNLQLPEKQAEPIDWEARFYDIAKEEFLRQSRVFSCDEDRAERAVFAASAFIEAMKAHQSKEKTD